MPQSLKSQAESSKPPVKRQGGLHSPGTVLPNGKTVVESHVAFGDTRLKVDPKTGKVTVDDSAGK